MAHISPAVYLMWAMLSTMLGSFLVFHLWSFDRFQCLKWNNGTHSGTFKRVMTYSYLLSVPLLIIYAIGFSIIKYNYGFMIVPGIGIMPTPYELWGKTAQNAVIPLYLSYSIAWGLEMVTHLEELCFWLFVVNSGSAQQDWFRSRYFKTWAVGSCVAVVAMPLITILTRQDVYKCEAITFLTGALGSLSLTIWFLPVLWTFPSFLANLRQNNVELNTMVRLTKFHELNCIRVVFRFLFTIPLVILGVDGVRPHQHINDKMFPTDFLGIIAGIGLVVSSGITLVIFFPRSIEGEISLRERRRQNRSQTGSVFSRWTRTHLSHGSEAGSYVDITHAHTKSELDFETGDVLAVNPSVSVTGLPAYESVAVPPERRPSTKMVVLHTVESISLQPNRRTSDGKVALGTVLSGSEVELIRERSRRERGVSNLVHQWRSPIDIARPTSVSRWERQV